MGKTVTYSMWLDSFKCPFVSNLLASLKKQTSVLSSGMPGYVDLQPCPGMPNLMPCHNWPHHLNTVQLALPLWPKASRQTDLPSRPTWPYLVPLADQLCQLVTGPVTITWHSHNNRPVSMTRHTWPSVTRKSDLLMQLSSPHLCPRLPCK